MMRGPERVATAVRLPSGEIAIHAEEFIPSTRKHRLLRLPVIRGGVTLIESLMLGIRALNYSAGVAMDEVMTPDEETALAAEAAEAKVAGVAMGADAAAPAEPSDPPSSSEIRAIAPRESESSWKTKAALTGTMVFAFALGIVFFFWIPLVLTDLIMDKTGTDGGVLFNLIDGVIRVVFFLAYIWGISLWGEMRRVFEYHGAEHKTIFMQEAGDELTPENARKYATKHPRCGTSFLLIVMVVSILVFMLFGRPSNIMQRLLRICMIPVIAGISYEFMKLSAKYTAKRWARMLSGPGPLASEHHDEAAVRRPGRDRHRFPQGRARRRGADGRSRASRDRGLPVASSAVHRWSQPMFEKLQEIKERFEELAELLMDPVVLSDRNLNKKYSKERASIEAVVHAYEEYEKVTGGHRRRPGDHRDERRRRGEGVRAGGARRARSRARRSSRSASRSCSSRGTPTTTRTPSSRYAPGPAGRRRRSSRRTSSGCTRATPRGRSGRSTCMNSNPSGSGGFKEIIFAVEGDAAYSRFKFESGVHRVQRVPATESQGRIHTIGRDGRGPARGRGGRRRDQARGRPRRRLPVVGPRRPERQHDRLGRAPDAQAHGRRRHVPGREERSTRTRSRR